MDESRTRQEREQQTDAQQARREAPVDWTQASAGILATIAAMLDRKEWTVEMLDQIAGLCRLAGYQVRDPHDDQAEAAGYNPDGWQPDPEHPTRLLYVLDIPEVTEAQHQAQQHQADAQAQLGRLALAQRLAQAITDATRTEQRTRDQEQDQ